SGLSKMRGSPFGPPRSASPAIACSTVCEYDCVPVGISVYSRRSRVAADCLVCACACGLAPVDLAGGGSLFLHAVAARAARATTVTRRAMRTGLPVGFVGGYRPRRRRLELPGRLPRRASLQSPALEPAHAR